MAAFGGMQNREDAAPKSAGLKDQITFIQNMHVNCHLQLRYRSKWNVIQHGVVFARKFPWFGHRRRQLLKIGGSGRETGSTDEKSKVETILV